MRPSIKKLYLVYHSIKHTQNITGVKYNIHTKQLRRWKDAVVDLEQEIIDTEGCMVPTSPVKLTKPSDDTVIKPAGDTSPVKLANLSDDTAIDLSIDMDTRRIKDMVSNPAAAEEYIGLCHQTLSKLNNEVDRLKTNQQKYLDEKITFFLNFRVRLTVEKKMVFGTVSYFDFPWWKIKLDKLEHERVILIDMNEKDLEDSISLYETHKYKWENNKANKKKDKSVYPGYAEGTSITMDDNYDGDLQAALDKGLENATEKFILFLKCPLCTDVNDENHTEWCSTIYYLDQESQDLTLDLARNFPSTMISSFISLFFHDNMHSRSDIFLNPMIWYPNYTDSLNTDRLVNLNQFVTIVGDGITHFGVIHIEKGKATVYDGHKDALPDKYKSIYIIVQKQLTNIDLSMKDVITHHPRMTRHGWTPPPSHDHVITYIPKVTQHWQSKNCGAIACLVLVSILTPNNLKINDEMDWNSKSDCLTLIKKLIWESREHIFMASGQHNDANDPKRTIVDYVKIEESTKWTEIRWFIDNVV